MNAAPPLVTVILRTMGRASLRTAVESVRAQGRSDLRLLVVDAAGHAPQEPPPDALLSWLSRGHLLVRPVAAQAGLDAAASRYALFLDDDDVLLPGHLDKLVAALQAHPEAVLAHTGVELVGADPAETGTRLGLIDEAFEPWELLGGNRLPIHAVLFDLERVRGAGAAFDPALPVYEDWDFWLQLALLGPFVHVPGVSARYHLAAGSSGVHGLQHGDEAYWRVWRKWWPRAPAAWWSEVLRQRDRAVGLARELAWTREALGRFQAGFAESEEQRRELAAQRDALQQELARVLAERDALQQELARGVAEREAAQLAAQAARARQHELEVALGEAQHREQALQAWLAASGVERMRLRDERAALLASRSWRVTAPLRRAESLAHGLRGRVGSWRRQAGVGSGVAAYREWIEREEAPEIAARHASTLPLAASGEPVFSLLMPVYQPRLDWLDEALASVQAQWWPHWELCIAEDASPDPQVRERLRQWAAREPRIRLVERASNGGIAAASNDALALAQGDWVAWIDQDDRLPEHALAELARVVHAHAEVQLIYSDEDKLDARGRRFEPHRKAGFCIERLRGQNYLNHLLAMRRALVLAAGGLRSAFDGAQDHDLLLRVCERLPADQVRHLPQVLYHWRCAPGSAATAAARKPQALLASLRAVNASLERSLPGAQAEGLPLLPWLRVRYPLHHPLPAVGGSLAGARGDEALQLLLAEGFELVDDTGLDELRSLLEQPGVGLVGSGPPPFEPGFGREWMVQEVEQLRPGALLLRREWLDAQSLAGPESPAALEALSQGLCAAVRARGQRVLWTPFAVRRRLAE